MEHQVPIVISYVNKVHFGIAVLALSCFSDALLLQRFVDILFGFRFSDFVRLDRQLAARGKAVVLARL